MQRQTHTNSKYGTTRFITDILSVGERERDLTYLLMGGGGREIGIVTSRPLTFSVSFVCVGGGGGGGGGGVGLSDLVIDMLKEEGEWTSDRERGGEEGSPLDY